MRKYRVRRRAVSTMIAGIIVLGLFLTALVAMVVVTEQYDSYQTLLNKMSQKDSERFSENLQFSYPGISPVSGQVPNCGGVGAFCNQYVLNVTNMANIGIQIVRIYINSTVGSCTSLCILDPASNPMPSKFRSFDSFINPSEVFHLVTFWLSTSTTFSEKITNMISAVTARGRVFSFQFPIPQTGSTAVPAGALYLGCLAIFFDQFLVTYTSPLRTTPLPLISGWIFPWTTYVILYVRVSNICNSDIKVLDMSTFYGKRYTGSGGGAAPAFFLVSPMSQAYCLQYFPLTYCFPTNTGNTFPSTTGTVLGYNWTKTNTCSNPNDPCYILPAAQQQGQPGMPAYLLFSSTEKGGTNANAFSPNNRNLYVVFLAMHWQCLQDTDKTCAKNYTFGVTLPFITVVTFAGP